MWIFITVCVENLSWYSTYGQWKINPFLINSNRRFMVQNCDLDTMILLFYKMCEHLIKYKVESDLCSSSSSWTWTGELMGLSLIERDLWSFFSLLSIKYEAMRLIILEKICIVLKYIHSSCQLLIFISSFFDFFQITKVKKDGSWHSQLTIYIHITKRWAIIIHLLHILYHHQNHLSIYFLFLLILC